MTRRAAVSALLCWFGLLPLRVSPSCFAANEYAPPSELIVSTASLDGRWVAAYASDGTLLLWETGTHHRRNLISDYKFSLGPDGLAFTPNSSSLVVGDANGLIQWLEIPSGKVLRKMQDKAWVDAFAFSADGSRLAARHHKGITIWDMKTGMELKYLPEESPFTAVALNHDGSVLVTGTEDGKIRMLDLLHDRQIATMELEPGDWVNCFEIDEPSQKLISAQGHNDISIWDTPISKKVRVLQGHEDQVDSVRLLPQSHTLVSVADDGTLKTWDYASGALLSTWSITPGFVTANGDRLMSLDPKTRHRIYIWSIASRKRLQVLSYRSPQKTTK
jgi:WD40 repeat protein